MTVDPLELAAKIYRSDIQRYVGADSACRRVTAPSCACVYIHMQVYLYVNVYA